jgi:hypothetical protein
MSRPISLVMKLSGKFIYNTNILYLYDFNLTLIVYSCFTDTVRLFDYVQQKQICEKKYASKGTSLLWAPKLVIIFLYYQLSYAYEKNCSRLRNKFEKKNYAAKGTSLLLAPKLVVIFLYYMCQIS